MLWKEVKEYVGVFTLSANIIHFDKLSVEELIDALQDGKFQDIITWDDMYETITDNWEYRIVGYKWFNGWGEQITKKQMKTELVNHLKHSYRCCKPTLLKWGVLEDFWEGVSEVITEHQKALEDKKSVAKRKREQTKSYKSTAKGMIAEINKIEAEKKKLIDRINSDREKLEKLTTKGKEWRKKLSAKREENYQKKN